MECNHNATSTHLFYHNCIFIKSYFLHIKIYYRITGAASEMVSLLENLYYLGSRYGCSEILLYNHFGHPGAGTLECPGKLPDHYTLVLVMQYIQYCD